MPDHKKKQSRESILITVVVSLIILTLIVVIFASRGGNDDNGGDTVEKGPWNDLATMKATISGVQTLNYYEIDGANSLDDVLEPSKSVYMLIGIEKGINSSELVSIGEYLDKGGHVIIADDGTEAERIADYAFGRTGGDVNFMGSRYLVDKKFSDPDGTDRGFVYNLSFIKGDTRPIDGRRFTTLIHEPNGLNFTGPGRPVMWTTKMLTVVDKNNNWQMDLDDEYMQFGDMAVEFDAGTNGGRITYFTSTGFFTDNVFDKYQNGDFLLSYIDELLPSGGDVILDQSKQTGSYSPHTQVIPD